MIAYIKRLLDTTDATASLRHFAFLVVVIAGVIFLGADLAVGLVKRGFGISSEWNFTFLTLTGAVTGSKIAGMKKPDGTAIEAPKE